MQRNVLALHEVEVQMHGQHLRVGNRLLVLIGKNLMVHVVLRCVHVVHLDSCLGGTSVLIAGLVVALGRGRLLLGDLSALVLGGLHLDVVLVEISLLLDLLAVLELLLHEQLLHLVLVGLLVELLQNHHRLLGIHLLDLAGVYLLSLEQVADCIHH